MIILVDSREQRPLEFKGDWKRKGMKVGDYGCLFSPTYQYPVVFERKGKGDLFGSLTQSYERFKRMFLKAEKLNIKIIIAIEGSKEKILQPYPHSARDPESIIKQLETIERKYGVSHIFFPSRISMSNYIVDYYLKKYEEYKALLMDGYDNEKMLSL